MKFTPVQKIPCLDDEDYAAYALYLKCLAEQLEDKFTEQFDALDSFRNRFAGVWRNDAAMTVSALTNLTVNPALKEIFWNDPNNPSRDGAGTTTDPVHFTFPGRVSGGLYEIGFSMAMNQGVDAGSLRASEIIMLFNTDFGFFSSTGTIIEVEESLSGGEFMTSSMIIPYDKLTPITPGLATFGLPFGFRMSAFESAAGTVTIPAEGLTVWCVYIGDNRLTEAA